MPKFIWSFPRFVKAVNSGLDYGGFIFFLFPIDTLSSFQYTSLMNFPLEIKNIIKDKPFSQDYVGLSDSHVLIFDDMVLKIEKRNLLKEKTDILKTQSVVDVMKWAKDFVTVPEVLCFCQTEESDYLLMSKIPGKMSCDTFYLENEYEAFLLRSQTSPVQVRTMLKGEGKVPIRMICPGKTYRRDDDDLTHSHQFHQVEGLVVGENISLTDFPASRAAFIASYEGTIASSIVFSSTVERPLVFIPSMATKRASIKTLISILPFAPIVEPAFINAVPYKGPEAPPTVDTSVIPQLFRIEPMSLSFMESNFFSTSPKPLARFMP